MKVFSKKRILLITAVAMVLLVSVTATLAYFSDFERAKGDSSLVLTGQTEITETPTDNSKTISVKNVSKDDVDMVTRVRVIAPVDVDFEPGANWEREQNGDWWYYTKVLAKGESTTDLVASWKIPADSTIENFDVVVVHESAVATYENGNVAKPDGWEYIPTIPAK